MRTLEARLAYTVKNLRKSLKLSPGAYDIHCLASLPVLHLLLPTGDVRPPSFLGNALTMDKKLIQPYFKKSKLSLLAKASEKCFTAHDVCPANWYHFCLFRIPRGVGIKN